MKRPILLVVVLVLLSACSSSGPALPNATAFHQGACQQAANALLSTARRASKGGHPNSLATELATQQTQLKRFTSQPDIQAVVTAIGFVRFQVDAHSYTDQLRKNVEAAARAAITACTAP